MYRFNKVKVWLRKLIERARITRRMLQLNKKKHQPLGSADWLAKAELECGGYQHNIARNAVSHLDPRGHDELTTGGMIGGDRMVHHDYASVYEKYLAPFVGGVSPKVVLECGILKGTGLAVWSKLFPEAQIVGLDIDVEHTRANLEFLKSRGAFKNSDPELLIFDQFKPSVEELRERLNGETLDIVIDDGFHSEETIVNTINALRPFLSSDFVYFVEDNSSIFKKIIDLFPESHVYSHGEMTVVTTFRNDAHGQ